MESALLITTGKAQIPFHDELMKWRVMSDPQEVVFMDSVKLVHFRKPFWPTVLTDMAEGLGNLWAWSRK